MVRLRCDAIGVGIREPLVGRTHSFLGTEIIADFWGVFIIIIFVFFWNDATRRERFNCVVWILIRRLLCLGYCGCGWWLGWWLYSLRPGIWRICGRRRRGEGEAKWHRKRQVTFDSPEKKEFLTEFQSSAFRSKNSSGIYVWEEEAIHRVADGTLHCLFTGTDGVERKRETERHWMDHYWN